MSSKKVFTLFLLILLSSLNAQEIIWTDVVETSNGRRFEGKIRAYEYGEQLTLELADGSKMIFNQQEIRKLRYATGKQLPTDASNNLKPVAVVVDKEKGSITRRLRPYLALMVHGGKQGNNRNFFNNNRIYGYGLEGMLFYQATSWFQFGLGGAYDKYNTNRGEAVVSALSAVRLVLTGKKVCPFFQLTAGYGQPIKTDRLPISNPEGGVLLHPAFGLRLGRSDQQHYSIDLGYRLLKTSYETNVFQGQEIRNNSYRRLSLRFGAIF